MVASVFFAPVLCAQDPPPGLVKRIAAVETAAQQAQSNYTYRQSVTVEELDKHGALAGDYHEVRDVIFSPPAKPEEKAERSEKFIGSPRMGLKNLRLTEEDFRDIREIQPFLLTTDQIFIYETRFQGDENMDGVDCWVVQIRPRQILDGQRLFDGQLWVDKSDFSVIRSEGKAVPEIVNTKTENLFPHFTTIRQKVDGQFWFPVTTYANDTLNFRSGPQRIRLMIRYSDYKRFGSDTKITFH
jgi:hypothetical protein